MKRKPNKNRLTHGMSYTRIYHIWQGIKQRANGQSEKEHYFDRGISVCENWKNSFESFYAWAISNGYEENLTLDRINVNGNYEPSNCRWVDVKTQNRNKTTTCFITLNGETKSLGEWGELLQIPISTLVNRKNKGLPAELILYRGKFNKRKPSYDNILKEMQEKKHEKTS